MPNYLTHNPEMVERRCLWCQVIFKARKADVKRGWGNFHSKTCKAKHQQAHGGRGVTQEVKKQRDTVILDKALAKDESFAEYDRVCQLEDKVQVTDQMLIDKAYLLYENCNLSLTNKQSNWLEDLIYDDEGEKVVKPQLTPSAQKFLTQIYNDNYTDKDHEKF